MSRWSAQSPEQLVAKASQHLPIWVSLMLVVLIAYYLARVVWLLFPSGEPVGWSPPQRTGGGLPAPSAGGADYGKIIESHLFGTASETSAAPVVVETENAPDTRLNLKLRAAVAATDSEVAHAIIADGSGNEKVYFLKNSIPGGATLHRVHADRVILNRGGVLETLRLPREFEGSPVPVTRRGPSAGSAAGAGGDVQQLIASNAATFAEIIRPQPFMPNGQLKGYRVFPGRNRQQFIALGLRPGDLVTAINGVELNNPAQGMEIFRSLGESSQVSVTIERAGQEQQLSLDMGQIADAGGTTR